MSGKPQSSRHDAAPRGAADSHPGRTACGSGIPIPIGLQLYSVHDPCAKDLPCVLQAAAAMGYRGVEFAGYHNHTAAELRAMLDGLGLVCCGTHAQRPSLDPGEIEATIEFNRILGNPYLIVPSMKFHSRAEWLREARYFDELAGQLEPHGMRVGYHAHAHDFEPVEDCIPWDLFFGNTRREVIMQLDTGNCLEAGRDPAAVLNKYPGRATTLHLKEYGGPPDAVIGGGRVAWPDVFKACESAGGTEWYIVEHERDRPDPLAEVGRCLDALRAMGKY